MSQNKKENNGNKGMIAIFVCGILTVAIIIGCIFFPEELFGLIKK